MPSQSLVATLAPFLAPGRIPLWLKLAYTAFMAVLVPVYWVKYGPQNFLYFCDIALFLTLVGLWREDRLLLSMPAVGILAPQVLWLADYFAHFAGLSITGVASYMFDQTKSHFLRGLSLFHGWLPILLVWCIWRLGYDRRAFWAWTWLVWIVLLVCYQFMPGPMPNPGDTAVNINYVFGMDDTKAQSIVHPLLWLVMLMIVQPFGLALPTHLLLARWRGGETARPAVA